MKVITHVHHISPHIFRCAELEKEVATLKQKIHQLDDMLKSQQRKVRHMIEQVCTGESGCVPQVDCFFAKTDLYVFVIFFCHYLVINAAAELSHHHSREGAIHPRPGGEGGFPGGGGQGSHLKLLSHIKALCIWHT